MLSSTLPVKITAFACDVCHRSSNLDQAAWHVIVLNRSTQMLYEYGCFVTVSWASQLVPDALSDLAG